MPVTPSYRHQSAWRAIQDGLPAPYHLSPSDSPQEDCFEWRGHQVYLDRYRRPESPVRVVLFHGVGTNARQMTTILGRPLAVSGIETVAIDMPTYGVTRVAAGEPVTYDDWVQLGTDFVAAELERDPRPIYLYGLSAGGMLTYHVASRSRRVSGIIGMTFLDLRVASVLRDAVLFPLMAPLTPLASVLGAVPGLRRLTLPMRWVAKMHTLVNDKRTLKACLADATSAGNSVSLAFLGSYLQAAYEVEPEDFDVCPILLTQPAEDRWTPLALSTHFLDRVQRVPVSQVMLPKAGHYPLEEPGLTLMHDAILDFIRDTQAANPQRGASSVAARANREAVC